jgi:hypothetical protein
MKKHLINFYLDRINNYLTVEKIAEHNGLTVTEAKALIKAGRKYHEQNANSKFK